MKKWQVENNGRIESIKEIVKILLANRGINSKKETEDFLNPDLSLISTDSVGISKVQIKKAVRRIEAAIKRKERIIVYGDYDVDGICASSILWETLDLLKADAMPFIPSRFEEGYGLSKEGLDTLIKSQKPNLIITVDNGIVANEAVDYANKNGIDVIVTDHHLPSKNLPRALSIVHTTKLCGAGVAYMLAKEILKQKIKRDDNHLELVALATIADLVPLTGANRIFVYFGLINLRKTKRIGFTALIQKAGIQKDNIGVYEIGHILAPRLNAMGRLASAMDSLRLICTKDKKRAIALAELLSKTNFERQQITINAFSHAKDKIGRSKIKNLIFIADEGYQQGIVGLVAGRLVEEYYFPSIVISKGEKYSKASARSVKGFNIVEFLRTASDLLVDVGGHPMAAGFTVETAKLDLLEKKLFESSQKLLKKEHLERVLRVDCELDLSFVNYETYIEIQKLAPFGMANPEPTFLTKNLIIESIRFVGQDKKHIKIEFKNQNSDFRISGIYFNGVVHQDLTEGEKVSIVYAMSLNEWNGNKRVELKIKDLNLLGKALS